MVRSLSYCTFRPVLFKCTRKLHYMQVILPCFIYPFLFKCIILWPLSLSFKHSNWVIIMVVSSSSWIIQYLHFESLFFHFQDGAYSRGPVDIAIGDYDESKYFLSPTYKFEQVCLLYFSWHFQVLQIECKGLGLLEW